MGTQISELTPLHQTTLLKSDQHKESSFLTGLGHGSYSLSPLGTGMVMAMGFPSCFFISHVFWLLPVVFELLCRSLLREQYQNSLFPVNEELEWAVGAWVIWKWWVGCSCHVGEDGPATVFLFFSKIGRRMGSASGRHTTPPLSAWVQTLWDPRIGCLQLFQVLGWLMLGLQLSPSMDPIVFKPNNHIISILWVHGFYVVFPWACEQYRGT